MPCVRVCTVRGTGYGVREYMNTEHSMIATLVALNNALSLYCVSIDLTPDERQADRFYSNIYSRYLYPLYCEHIHRHICGIHINNIVYTSNIYLGYIYYSHFELKRQQTLANLSIQQFLKWISIIKKNVLSHSFHGGFGPDEEKRVLWQN